MAEEILIFVVGGQRHGLPVAQVQELLPAQAVLPVAGAAAPLEGLINLRGAILPVVDVRGGTAATVQLSNLWTLFALVTPYYPKWVENRETQDGARTERVSGNFWAFEVKSDPNQPFVVGISGNVDKTMSAASPASFLPTPMLSMYCFRKSS